MTLVRSLVALTLALAAPMALVPHTAHACGEVVDRSPETALRRVVALHYAAIGRGDAATARALWSPDARVGELNFSPVYASRCCDPGRPPVAYHITAEASQRTARRLEFVSVTVTGERAEVVVRLRGAGALVEEHLSAHLAGARWVLTGLASGLVPQPAAT